MNKWISTLFLLAILPLKAHAQLSRLVEDVQFKAEAMGSAASGDIAPFWFTNNRYGLATPDASSGYLRGAMWREAAADSARRWKAGYGIDIAVPFGMDSHFVLQQLYADIQWKVIRLSVGQKERPLELKNQLLSGGAMTSSINARPLPQIRLELPEFWTIPRTRNWLALKAHIAYGAYTDNGWQRQFNHLGPQNLYTANSLYHTKAGFLRIGNAEKFPLSLTGGFEMSSQFAGEAWNLKDRDDHADPNFQPHQKMPHNLNAFWHALIPGGSDSNDGDYKNVEGNQLGSWHLRLDYNGKGWSVGVYAEHFFEDHSQLFWQYPWKDMLYGVEINLPKNRFIQTIVYEHIGTKDQSGPIYHDGTAVLPDNIYGVDNYYNHQVYGAWQHAGFSMGHAALLSPIYNTDGNIMFRDNRINANHLGLCGTPTNEISYRVLLTHEKSWGTYPIPRSTPAKGTFLLAELSYAPHQIKGLSFTASFGRNWGTLLGDTNGGMLSIVYSGWVSKKKN